MSAWGEDAPGTEGICTPGEDKAGDGSGRSDDLTQRAGFGTGERTERPAKCKGSRAHEAAR